MSRYTDAKCRVCRRHSSKLFLKGPRCYSDKCAMEKRPFPPGAQKGSRRRLSGYGLQLKEKQRVRFMYGISENQFKNYFEKANRLPGVTGENLLSLLERRLDNVVFRAGWADSRSDARQMVLHGHFMVNGRKVDIPSYLVDEGDVVEISPRGKEHKKIKELMEEEKTPSPAWLGISEDGKVTILRNPQRGDIDYSVEEQLIVEFYSK